MISSKLTILSIVAVTIGTNAYADLSPNPWAEPNDKETIEEIYQKSNKSNNNGRAQYIPERTSEVDISKKRVTRIRKKNNGFSFGGLFSSNKSESPAQQPSTPQPQTSDKSDNDIFGIKSGVDYVKKGIDDTIEKTNNFYDRTMRNFQSSVKSLSKTLK